MKERSGARSALLLTTLGLVAAQGAIGFLYARAPLDWSWSCGDLGQWVDVADRMLAGQRPYRDFLGLYGPLTYSAVSAGYRLCGANWFAALLQLEVVWPVISLLLAAYVAARSFATREARLLFMGTVAALGLHHFSWSPAGRVWIPLACLMFAADAVKRVSRPRAAIAALLCGTCPFVSFETGAAAVACCALFAAACVPASASRRSLLPCLSLVAAPALLAWSLDAGVVRGYWYAMLGLAEQTNWYAGRPFPSFFPLSMQTYLFFVPIAAVGALGGAALWRALRRKEGVEWIEDAAVAVFAALSLRTLLGRSDYEHLLFVLPPILVLGLRRLERSPLSSWGAAGLWAAVLAPFVAVSLSSGELRRDASILLESGRPDLVDWNEEGVRVLPVVAARMRRISAFIDERVPPGEAVLSLPLPMYAHFARRPSALISGYPEHLMVWKDGPRLALAELESRRVALAVLDQSLPLSMPRDWLGNFRDADPLSGRLTWSSLADEVITRELRAYLRERFAPERVLEGVVMMGRRPQAVPAARETEVFRIDGPRALAAGRACDLEVPAKVCREVRVRVRCRYLPGEASLAKAYLKATVFFEGAAPALSGFLPVPPESLGKDLRFEVPARPIRSLRVQIFSPGAFNPSPRSADLEWVRFVDVGGRP